MRRFFTNTLAVCALLAGGLTLSQQSMAAATDAPVFMVGSTCTGANGAKCECTGNDCQADGEGCSCGSGGVE